MPTAQERSKPQSKPTASPQQAINEAAYYQTGLHQIVKALLTAGLHQIVNDLLLCCTLSDRITKDSKEPVIINANSTGTKGTTGAS